MVKPTYTAPPNPAPVLGDPDFASDAQGYLGWFATFGTYMSAYSTWLETEYIAALADGTAGAPSLAFISDPDTGIYRAGANQLAFSEGGVDMGRFYGRKNILGTVAQSGGVPTGAIFEVGSNANGTYTKYADGKMTCISPQISGQDVTTGTGSIFRTASLGSWTFPATFSATPPIVLAGSAGSNTSTHWGNARPLTTTTAEYTVFAPASITGRSIILRAEGKWF